MRQYYNAAALNAHILPIYTALSNLVFQQKQEGGKLLFLSKQTATFQTSSNILLIVGYRIVMSF